MSQNSSHIFFIASWLPSKHDAYEGDFILRHAQAIALLHPVSVAFVIESEIAGDADLVMEEEYNNNLHIYRYYLHSKYKKIWNKKKYYQTIESIYQKVNAKKIIDIIHANIHWRAGYSAYLLHKKFNKPYVISEHSGYFNTVYYQQNSIATYGIIKKYLVRKVLVNATFCLPVSQYLANWMKKFDNCIRTKVISNVVDVEQFCFTKPLPISPFIFIHASMGWPEKNVDIIVEAVSLLEKERQDFEMYFYTPLEKKTNLQIDTNIIKYKGIIAHNEMQYAIQNSHANILYSTVETQGCIIIESLCCGRPMIVSNATVFSEMISNGENGLISKDTTADSLKMLMMQMMDNYEIFDKEQIAKNAIAKYGMQSIGDSFSKIYEEVLLKNKDG
jgi:glycosyltransferase involved in cell wall biosynthesis